MNPNSACLPEDASKQEQQNETQTMTVLPQPNEERALKWVRCECYKRCHGVYVESPPSRSIRLDDCSAGRAQGTTQ